MPALPRVGPRTSSCLSHRSFTLTRNAYVHVALTRTRLFRYTVCFTLISLRAPSRPLPLSLPLILPVSRVCNLSRSFSATGSPCLRDVRNVSCFRSLRLPFTQKIHLRLFPRLFLSARCYLRSLFRLIMATFLCSSFLPFFLFFFATGGCSFKYYFAIVDYRYERYATLYCIL